MLGVKFGNQLSEKIGGAMTKDEEKVLEKCCEPSTPKEIAKTTGLSLKEVSKIIHKLEKNGLIISQGATSALRHMTLAAAIKILFKEVHQLSLKSNH